MTPEKNALKKMERRKVDTHFLQLAIAVKDQARNNFVHLAYLPALQGKPTPETIGDRTMAHVYYYMSNAIITIAQDRYDQSLLPDIFATLEVGQCQPLAHWVLKKLMAKAPRKYFWQIVIQEHDQTTDGHIVVLVTDEEHPSFVYSNTVVDPLYNFAGSAQEYREKHIVPHRQQIHAVLIMPESQKTIADKAADFAGKMRKETEIDRALQALKKKPHPFGDGHTMKMACNYEDFFDAMAHREEPLTLLRYLNDFLKNPQQDQYSRHGLIILSLYVSNSAASQLPFGYEQICRRLKSSAEFYDGGHWPDFLKCLLETPPLALSFCSLNLKKEEELRSKGYGVQVGLFKGALDATITRKINKGNIADVKCLSLFLGPGIGGENPLLLVNEAAEEVTYPLIWYCQVLEQRTADQLEKYLGSPTIL